MPPDWQRCQSQTVEHRDLVVQCAYLTGAIAPTAVGALKQAYGVGASMDMLAAVALGTGFLFLAVLMIPATLRRARQ